MAQIQPINIWKDGQVKIAEEFNLIIVRDDMATSCTFYYELKEATVENISGQILTVGNEVMDSQDYQNWDGSNAEAYSFVANKLNIVLV